jgi:hypothetical protein
MYLTQVEGQKGSRQEGKIDRETDRARTFLRAKNRMAKKGDLKRQTEKK